MMRSTSLLLIPALLLCASIASAEDAGHAPGLDAPPADVAPPPPPPDGAQAPEEAPEQLLSEAELDQLVAPIALYPDPLLAQVLMASTYPLEVVAADRFAKAHEGLKGDALEAELAKEDWDDSVKSLVETPQVLAMMSDQLDWLQALGDAVLAQQPDVMDAVQRLRAQAEANGKLQSTPQQVVQVNQDAGPRQIVIQPAQPDVVYVPYYEPQVVYGSWRYPDYPPYYFAPSPSYVAVGAIATGIAFGAGYALARRSYWDDVDWGRRNIRVYQPYNKNVYINRNVYNNNVNINRNNVNVTNWQHNAYHRRGVKYKDPVIQQKYGNAKFKAGKAAAIKQYRKGNWPKDLNPKTGQFPKANLNRKPNFGNQFNGKPSGPSRGFGAGKQPDFGKFKQQGGPGGKPNFGNGPKGPPNNFAKGGGSPKGMSGLPSGVGNPPKGAGGQPNFDKSKSNAFKPGGPGNKPNFGNGPKGPPKNFAKGGGGPSQGAGGPPKFDKKAGAPQFKAPNNAPQFKAGGKGPQFKAGKAPQFKAGKPPNSGGGKPPHLKANGPPKFKGGGQPPHMKAMQAKGPPKGKAMGAGKPKAMKGGQKPQAAFKPNGKGKNKKKDN